MQKSQGTVGWPARLATRRLGSGLVHGGLWTARGAVDHGSTVDRGRARGGSCGGEAPGHGGAPWPALASSLRRRSGAWGAMLRAQARSAGRGEADARVCGDRECPGRRVCVAGRLSGGRTTPARARTRERSREKVGESPTCSSPPCGAPGVVRVVWEAAADEFDGGGDLGPATMAAAQRGWASGWRQRCPRARRRGAGCSRGPL